MAQRPQAKDHWNRGRRVRELERQGAVERQTPEFTQLLGTMARAREHPPRVAQVVRTRL